MLVSSRGRLQFWMTLDLGEGKFEAAIEEALVKNGYVRRTSENLSKTLALDIEIIIRFMKKSQPQSWKRLEEDYGSTTADHIIHKLNDEIESESILHVLRSGFKVSGIHLDCI